VRALFLEELAIQENYVISGDPLHHLVNVIRIEKGEKLLLLNGKGLQVLTIVESTAKRELRLQVISHESKVYNYHIDLVLGMPKRDALELCLKEATELGFKKIYLIKSAYSQMKFPEQERIQKLLISALEQSNASMLPEVICTDWKDIPWEQFDEILLLDSQTKEAKIQDRPGFTHTALIVGPEGGFSPEEISYLHSLKKIQVVNLPTPILRSPTAVATGAGIMLQRLLK
jgi:16S rRNA (uracil1498-N3)-methyltransferase